MKRLRVAIIADYPEEGWPSMDLTAEMLVTHLNDGHGDAVDAVRVCPAYHRRFTRLPGRRAARIGRNVDRMINRYVDYPRDLCSLLGREQFDLFHLVDHSYAQLVHDLPAGRTVVTCNDLDTFRCLLHPELEDRPLWFKALTRRTLQGMRKAGAVAAISEFTRAEIVRHRLVDEPRLSMIYLGTHPEYIVDPPSNAEAEAVRIIGDHETVLLHVGSNIPRKRIDVLLATFAGVRQALPDARLIRVGGEFTPSQTALAKELGVLDAVVILPFLAERSTLAALYRRASLVLQPSEAEGFGLPLVEAMACGAQLLTSDIPVLREVAGNAAVTRPVGEIPSWTAAALKMIDDHRLRNDAYLSRVEEGRVRSLRFRWTTHAQSLVELYRNLAR